jgi:hypothetical protein
MLYSSWAYRMQQMYKEEFMSLKSAISKSKDPENRSKKECTCDGHNAHNPKKNKKNHSTKSKIDIRKSRNFQSKMIDNKFCDRIHNIPEDPDSVERNNKQNKEGNRDIPF